MTEPRKLLSIGEATVFFGVSIDTIRRWDEVGLLHSVRPTGKTRFFYKDELEKLKASSFKGSRIKSYTLQRMQRKASKNKKSVDLPSQEKTAQSTIIPPTSIPPEASIELKPWQRIPEFAISVAIFLLLLSLGIKNIMTISARSRVIPQNSVVLSETTSTKKITPTSTENIKPNVTVTIKADLDSIVTIREEAATSSAKIGEAKDGDVFELVSVDSQWSEVKLTNGWTGFISTSYTTTNEQHE